MTSYSTTNEYDRQVKSTYLGWPTTAYGFESAIYKYEQKTKMDHVTVHSRKWYLIPLSKLIYRSGLPDNSTGCADLWMT